MKIIKDFSYKNVYEILPYNGRSDLQNINFKYCDFSAFDFDDQVIKNCSFSHCFLTKSEMRKASFVDCIFSFCDLSFTEFITAKKSKPIDMSSCIFFKCEYNSTSLPSAILDNKKYAVIKYAYNHKDPSNIFNKYIISNRFIIKNNVLDMYEQ